MLLVKLLVPYVKSKPVIRQGGPGDDAAFEHSLAVRVVMAYSMSNRVLCY